MINPTVHTASVEHVAAVSHPSDLIILFKFIETDGAALRRARGRRREVGEADDGEHVPDEGGGDGGGGGGGDWVRLVRGGGPVVVEIVVWFEELGEADGAEEG